MLIQQIFIGLLLIGIGVVSLKFNFQLGNLVKQQWIESKIGYGTTFTVYKIFSILLVLTGIIVLAGFGDDVINWATAPLKGLFRVKAN